jgi:hypothetical protein
MGSYIADDLQAAIYKSTAYKSERRALIHNLLISTPVDLVSFSKYL